MSKKLPDPVAIEAVHAALADKRPAWRPQDDIAEAAIDLFLEEPTQERWATAWKETNREAADGAYKLAVDDARRLVEAFSRFKREDTTFKNRVAHPTKMMSYEFAELIAWSLDFFGLST